MSLDIADAQLGVLLDLWLLLERVAAMVKGPLHRSTLGVNYPIPGPGGLAHSYSYPDYFPVTLLYYAIYGVVLEDQPESTTGQNVAVYTVLGTPQFDHITLLLHKLHEIQFNMLIIPFTALNGTGQDYLWDNLFLRVSIHPIIR